MTRAMTIAIALLVGVALGATGIYFLQRSEYEKAWCLNEATAAKGLLNILKEEPGEDAGYLLEQYLLMSQTVLGTTCTNIGDHPHVKEVVTEIESYEIVHDAP